MRKKRIQSGKGRLRLLRIWKDYEDEVLLLGETTLTTIEVDQTDDKPEHYCGIVGMALTINAPPELKRALRVIQHRGQEAAGVAIFDGGISYLRGMGLVHEVLTGQAFDALKGNVGIGHVRYSTTGTSCAQNCQPMTVKTSSGDVAIAHNGDIVNADKLRSKLQTEGWAFLTTTDSEIIIRLLANELKQNGDQVKAIRATMKHLDGSFSLTIMIGNKLYGVRDPLGFRPLCIGRLANGYCLASESAVFDVLQGQFIRDMLPGEVVELTTEGFIPHRSPGPVHKAHCMFEWVYFARPDSIIDGKEVYNRQKKAGHDPCKGTASRC